MEAVRVGEFRERLNFFTPEAWIPELIVGEDSRGKGIGAALLAQDEVAHVYENLTFEAMTTTSLPFIKQSDAAAAIGYDPDNDSNFVEDLGSFGTPTQRVGIAVLDGRMDVTHASFGCSAVATPASCRVLGYHDASQTPESHTEVSERMVARPVGATSKAPAARTSRRGSAMLPPKSIPPRRTPV